jgi:cation diffusion facilitator CzcD-associated flavoprotein CzcO
LLVKYIYKFNLDGENSMTKVAIIGAGPCGLAQLRAFESAQIKK